MTTRARFLATMAQRRRYPRGSMDYNALTRAARKYVWIMRGVPVNNWTE